MAGTTGRVGALPVGGNGKWTLGTNHGLLAKYYYWALLGRTGTWEGVPPGAPSQRKSA